MGCQSDGKYIATKSTKSFDGLCCPPPILNKPLLDANLTFEYKFSLIMAKDMYWKNKKIATTARTLTYKPIAVTGLCALNSSHYGLDTI